MTVKELLKKIVRDTLQNEQGKFSRKSITAFFSFAFAVSYELLSMIKGFESSEYVFNGLIFTCLTCLGIAEIGKFRK